ncbi:MAG: GGDEF domain-containing protein, partial [Candidatus Dormibacteraeota bacterium]|nr:GGDEF domain-containing protein [Candidatus Dormibacteraeota bacterium]
MRSLPLAARLTGSHRLVAFGALLGGGALAVWLLPLHGVTRPALLSPAPWYAVLLACFAASLVNVELRAGRYSFTSSLAEIPLAAGLFLAEPHVLLGCYAGGALLAHIVRRGVQPAKDFANLMLDSLCAGIAVWVFTVVGWSAASVAAPRSVLALAVAMTAATFVAGPLLLNAGIVVYQGRIGAADLAASLVSHGVSTVVDVCVALAVVLFVADSPLLLFALIPPAGLLLLSQTALRASHRTAERIEFLYHASETLHAPRPVDERAADLLGAMITTFGVTRCELVLVPELRDAALRFAFTSESHAAMVSSSELTYAEQEALNALRTLRMMSGRHTHSANSALGLVLAERGATSGTVVSLRGRERPQGMLLLLDPLSGDSTHSARETELLVTVAQQISVALENGQLATALRTMTNEREEFARRAFYDPLTQIANRSLFDETVTRALAKLGTTRKPVALLCIDLDGFAALNERHGHAVGDQALSAVAARLRTQIRRFDMVARLGGDEFGVLLDGMRRRDDIHIVAQRIVEAIHEPIAVPGGEVQLGGSIGIAIADDAASAPPPEEL